MKVLVFLPLLSLVSIGSGCFCNLKDNSGQTTPTTTTSSTTTTTTTTPVPPVTRLATPGNSCTGAEPRGTTILRTVTLNTAASGTGSVTQAATFTAATTEKVFCHTVIDRKTGANVSSFAKTAGDFMTSTVTITATSAAGQGIDADVIFFGTL